MAYIGKREDLSPTQVDYVERLILKSLTGVDLTLAANGCLMVGIAICIKGGATKDQVKEAILGMIDAFQGERSN